MKTEKIVLSLATIVLILLTLGVISTGQNPEFYDFFGLIVFTFLTGLGIYMLKNPKNPPRWIWFTLLMIGILGLLVDGSVIVREFIKWF